MSSQESLDRKEVDVVAEGQIEEPVTIKDYMAEERAWWKVGHLRMLSWAVFLITLTSTNNGYDGSMLNGLQSLQYWQKDMGHPQGQRLGALSNATIFGNIAAIPLGAWLSDRFGRRPSIIFGQTLTVIGAILQGVSTNYGFFLGSRLVLGFGTCIATTSSPTLISEISYPTHRETGTFFYNTSWYLGAMIASWVTYGTRNLNGKASWTIPSYMQGALPFFQLVFFWMVPESPRYYISKGKHEQARKVLSKFHTGNSEEPRKKALVEFEMREIESSLEKEKMYAQTSYLDFFTKKNLRKRLFLCTWVGLMMQLSGNGLVSYYLVKVLNSIGITETDRQLEINGCLMIYNLVIGTTLASSVRFFKRRFMFITCLTGMMITYIIWTALSAVNQQRHFSDKGLANGVLAMIFFYYLFYDIGLNGLPFLFATEILPYSHRTKGINILQFSSLVGQVYNGYVNPIAMDAISWKYYIVYCCILCVELIVVILFFPETSGYTLEEVAQVFGDEAPGFGNRQIDSGPKRSLEHVERA